MIMDDLYGKTLVMTTTNGTKAILASLEAEHVAIGAMINAEATIRWAASFGLPVHVVCAGTDGLVSWEDTLLAGQISLRLNITCRYVLGNDAALIADAVYRNHLANIQEKIPRSLILARGRGGRRVREVGLQDDIDAAAREENHEHSRVGVVQRDPLRITTESWTPRRSATIV